jgi:hypothetical protein
MGANDFLRLGGLVRALIGASVRRSPAFEAFRHGFCTEGGAGRRLDLEALASLGGGERRAAERMLLNALPDASAVAGLGELATRRAARRLTSLFEQECARAQAACIGGDAHWSGALMIATAAALWRIAPQDRFARALIGRLRYARAASERMDAGLALARMPTAEVDEALNEALDDRDALVRHHAARSLLAIHGVEVDVRATHCMIYRVMAGEAARREEGRRDIASALAQRPLLSVWPHQEQPGALI